MNESDLIARLTALEATNKATEVTESFFVVYDPTFVRVWCPRTECPNLGRNLEVEIMETKLSDAQAIDKDGQLVELEGDEVVQTKVIRDLGAKKSHHPLGVIASFKSEREAVQWCSKYYKTNQRAFEGMDAPPALEIIEITLN